MTNRSDPESFVCYGEASREALIEDTSGTVAFRRLVTSRKGQFRWRSPVENPYILRDETRSTVGSRYDDVIFAMGNVAMESRMR